LVQDGARATRRGEPLHLQRDLEDSLRDHRVHLARHDRGAGLDRRELQLPESAEWPRAPQTEIAGDREQCPGDTRECVGERDRGFLRGDPGGRVPFERQREPGLLRQQRDGTGDGFSVGTDAGADGSPAQRQ